MVSVAHQIALAALAPDRLYEVDRSAASGDATGVAVAEFAAKVEVVPDPALASFYPQHWPADVEIEAGGATPRHRVVEAFGDPEHPLGRDAVDDKAHRVLGPLLGAPRVGEWLAMAHAALDGAGQCKRLATAFAGLD
jgi:2-methylcitrate dehydratase PrpD